MARWRSCLVFSVGLRIWRSAWESLVRYWVSGCLAAGQAGCTKWDPKGHGSFRFRGFTPDGEAGGNQVRLEAACLYSLLPELCPFGLPSLR